MSTGREGVVGTEATTGRQWPYCAAIDGTCLSYDMAENLGVGVESALMTFIFSAREGARLILQKNRSGITLQVTGPVEKAERAPFKLAEARALRKRLDALKIREPRE